MKQTGTLTTQLKGLFTALMIKLGYSPKFSGVMASFLVSPEELVHMAQYLLDNPGATEQDVMNEMAATIEATLSM